MQSDFYRCTDYILIGRRVSHASYTKVTAFRAGNTHLFYRLSLSSFHLCINTLLLLHATSSLQRRGSASPNT